MSLTPRTVEVFLAHNETDILVGRAWFEPTRAGTPTTFSYDPTYLERKDCYALDPGLSLDSGRHHVVGLFGAFNDAAPDRWGRRLIQRALQQSGARQSLGDVDYLLSVSDELRQGNLRFRAPDSQDWLTEGGRAPRLIELPQLASAVVTADDDRSASVKALLEVGSETLGGARPKATVLDGERLHVAKFARTSDEWNVIGLEKSALDLAELAGVDVPARKLVQTGSGPVLLLQRFDRDRSKRVGYLSAMSLLQRRDHDDRPADYLDLAEQLEVDSSNPTSDLRQLWLRIAVSVALHNTDDHLRNHGVIRAEGWRLAPAFDINPNPAVSEVRATAIAGSAQAAEVDALMQHAPLFRLTTEEARLTLAKVASATDRWHEITARNNVVGEDAAVLGDAIAIQAPAIADAAHLP